MYRDVRSPSKTKNTDTFIFYMKWSYNDYAHKPFGDSCKHLKVLTLDGANLRTTRLLIDHKIPEENITIVELHEKTWKAQKAQQMRCSIVGPQTLGNYLSNCSVADLPNAVYFDYMCTWTGSHQCRPMKDIHTYLRRSHESGKKRVVIALTFATRNNYGGKFSTARDKLINNLRRNVKGRLVRKRSEIVHEKDIIETLLRHWVFPSTGWCIKYTNDAIHYRKKHNTQTMTFMIFTLDAVIPNAHLRSPFEELISLA